MTRAKVVKEVKPDFVFTVGRRKEAVARVRLFGGKGEMIVNEKPITQYFSGKGMEALYLKPFKETGTLDKYFMTARIVGGGQYGQLQALVHGVSRALALVEEKKFRPILKGKKLLTRDARTRERRKVGMGGKARRRKQSPKR